jgi:hypothetical protein|tara:strand:- start:934 stop:1182 length:249 start_codon:yes stop_codon:yes gene_type:complete
MSTCYQLDLFESNDPITLIQKDFRLLDKKCQNVQRGLFARIGTIQEEVETLRDLCYKMRLEIDDLKGSREKAEIIEFKKENQ